MRITTLETVHNYQKIIKKKGLGNIIENLHKTHCCVPVHLLRQFFSYSISSYLNFSILQKSKPIEFYKLSSRKTTVK